MKEKSNRRDFIKTSSAAAVAAGSITFPTVTFGKPDSRKLKIGFIGCGGRGTGAASQIMNSPHNTKLVAVADAFIDKAQSTVNRLKKQYGKL